MDRFNNTRKASILGIAGNIFLLLIKAIVGFASHSQAMIADATNSAGDIFASLMTFIGNKIASEPSDESHNFGHGKAEYIFSMLISISILFVATKSLYDSVLSLIYQKTFIFSWFLVIVCIITISIKLFLYIYTRRLYKQYEDLLLKSNMEDHRNDCILTLFTLASILFGLMHIYFLDGIVGIIISIWIFYTGIKIFIESYNVLMDRSINDKTKEIIFESIKRHEEIKKVDSIYSTPIGYQYIVTITIYVDGNMSTFDSHQIADELENEIQSIDNIAKAFIHVNPI